MPETVARPRCVSCGRGLAYDAWSRGADTCEACARLARVSGPAATYVRGPAPARVPAPPPPSTDPSAAYERILDQMPDELVDELVAALEAEVEKLEREKASPKSPVQDVLEEMGFGRSPRDWQWAAWGFAGGFAANVLLAKYAQMASGGSMSEFAGPLLIGGMVAGTTCAAIGWGFARLRTR